MDIIYHPIFLKHDTGKHPENKERLESLGKLPTSEFESGEQYLELVHDRDYIKRIQDICSSGGGVFDSDTSISEHSYEAACMAVGAVIKASQTNGFAVVKIGRAHV